MGKRTIWKHTILSVNDIANWLTTHNLKQNKFHLCNLTEDVVLVVYVDKEVPNVD